MLGVELALVFVGLAGAGALTWWLGPTSPRAMRRTVAELEAGDLAPDLILGCPVVEERTFAGTAAQNDKIELYSQRTTITGLLPRALSFGWSKPASGAASGPIGDRSALWVDLLFGGGVAHLDEGTSIQALGGDLLFSSPPRPERACAALSGRFRALAAAIERDRLPDLLFALTASGKVELRVTATRSFLHVFPDDPRAAPLLARAATDPSDVLRATAAAATPKVARAALIALADDPHASDEARTIAVRALLRAGDRPALLALRAHPVPSAVRGDLLDVLRATRDPVHEPAVMCYLSGDARAQAIDVLAVLGTRDAIAPLQALRAKGRLDPDAGTGCDVAIELIQGRLALLGGATHGTLALVDETGEGGALSLSRDVGGALSVAEERGGELSDPED